MSRNLPRKRHLQLQNETDDIQAGATTAALLNGKHVRSLQNGLLRRTHILFSLLRRYPVVVLLLFLIVWAGLRLWHNRNHTSLQSESNKQFQHELTKPSQLSFVNDALTENFEQRRIQRLSNLRDTPQGIFMDVQLEGARRGIVKVFTQETSQNASHAEYIPRLHQLAKLLHLHHGFTSSYGIRLPIALQEPLADRHLAKALCRACGYRSPSKVTEGTTVAAYVVPMQSGSLGLFSALRTPTTEPYEWTSNLPTSQECSHSNYDQPDTTEQTRCRQLTEIMIVMYLAGCAPPGDDAFVLWNADVEDDGSMFKVAFPKGCFGRYEDNSVLLDLVLAFVGKTCSLPSGRLALIKSLGDIGWGVGKRAKLLEKRLVLLNHDHGGICRNRGWTFYQERTL